MRIVIDLQGAQCGSRHRGIGRYSLALAQAMVRNRGDHEVIIALNGLFPETIEPIRVAFDSLLSQENIRVWHAPGPVSAFDSASTWRRHTAEMIRENFLASLQPDIVHITSLMEGFDDNAVHSIGLLPIKIPTAVTFYDVIPLIQNDVYLAPNPIFEGLYREKLAYLSQADIYFAISESSRLEAIDHLGATTVQAVNIAAAADDIFKPIDVSPAEEQAIRKKFKITRSFVMYSGATDERKNHLRLIKAFSILPIGLQKKYQLAIVGHLPDEHRKKFQDYTKFCGLKATDVLITGRVSDEEMVHLYNLCDLFVFPSWHEGFGLPALEAMSCGAPVIGSNTTSLPEVIGRKDALFDPFDEKSIAIKIAEVLTDANLRKELEQHGPRQAKNFSWDESAKRAITALESWYVKQSDQKSLARNGPDNLTSEYLLIEGIAKISNPPANEEDWLMTASAINQNHYEPNEKQLLVDVSQLVTVDSKTGIQRVVRSVLLELLANPPEGFQVEPIYGIPGQQGYRYARQFLNRFLHHPEAAVEDGPVIACYGDIFLGLDLGHHIVIEQARVYSDWRRNGVQVYFVIYDLLPVLMPEVFRDVIAPIHAQWLTTLAQTDGVLCISRAVADDMVDWLSVFGGDRSRSFKLGWFHLGGDVAGSIPSMGFPADAEHVLNALSSRPSFLMVGTLEPRKGQMQALAAFEQLWDQDLNVNLVLVGQYGWNVDLLIEMIRKHPELNRRLFWLEGISDEYLEKVYAASTCLIAASEGEGFGLPLIEAAQHKKPIIARDIPVFREVAGDYAFYFSGRTPKNLSGAVCEWLALNKAGKAPKSETMPWLTWKQSTKHLLDVMLGGQWYQHWIPDTVLRFWGGDNRLGTQVGKRIGPDMVSEGQAGYLLFGPYIPLASGQYRVVIRGTLSENGLAGARMDVAIDKGSLILGTSVLNEPDENGNFIALLISLDAPCTDLEVRVWVNQDTDLKISMIEITPLQGEQTTNIDTKNIAGDEYPDRDMVLIKSTGQQQSAQVLAFKPTSTEPTQHVAEVEAKVSQ
jgi:glycosyltransferase involved in cell wall biosynthesis